MIEIVVIGWCILGSRVGGGNCRVMRKSKYDLVHANPSSARFRAESMGQALVKTSNGQLLHHLVRSLLTRPPHLTSTVDSTAPAIEGWARRRPSQAVGKIDQYAIATCDPPLAALARIASQMTDAR